MNVLGLKGDITGVAVPRQLLAVIPITGIVVYLVFMPTLIGSSVFFVSFCFSRSN